MREFTPLAVVLGLLIGAVFGAANAYIGLKVGMTVSASIPAAVISMGLMRGLLKRGSLLENNMVQTIGSAGESLAAGMIFTVPALFIMGNDPAYYEMVIWGGIGGLIGVLFMIPLRKVLIVREHGVLPYPEGVACAEVLQSGERGGGGAKIVFTGLGVGALYELFRKLGFWRDEFSVGISKIRTEAALDASPALLGVGYILGARIAAYMLGGAVLGWFVLIPCFAFFGADATSSVAPEPASLISEMGPGDMWNRYLRYVGAGAVVFGGLLSLFKSAPTIVSSLWHIAAGVFSRTKATVDRSDRDLPLPILALFLGGLGYAMYHFPEVRVGTAGAIAVLVFGFFFVTVSSRLVGLVGSSSNPASGMTIATLLGTTLVFAYVLKDTGEEAKYAALSVGALVCIAVCIAGDCSQDLKTGFLVKATPWKQQVGEIIGVLTATIVIAGVITLLNKTYGFDAETNPNALLAPQANIMKLLVEGVMDQNLPWTLIIMGMAAALVVELLGIPSLPFAVGLYLPLSLSTPIMSGGLIRWIIDKRRKSQSDDSNPGILGASGLVAGEGLMGLCAASATGLIAYFGSDPRYLSPVSGQEEPVVPSHFMQWFSEKIGMAQHYGLSDFNYHLLAAIPFSILMLWLLITALKKTPEPQPQIVGQNYRSSVSMADPDSFELTEDDVD